MDGTTAQQNVWREVGAATPLSFRSSLTSERDIKDDNEHYPEYENQVYSVGAPNRATQSWIEKQRQTGWAVQTPGIPVSDQEKGIPLRISQPAVLEKAPRKSLPFRGKRYGRKGLWALIIVSVLLVLAVALTAGLVVGLKNAKKPPKPAPPPVPQDTLVGGALNPVYYSTEGAFNGTDIALANQTLSDDTVVTVMYFQYWSGDIRYLQLGDASEWTGGSSSMVIATDAKNNTPISTVSYSEAETSTQHLFYIDTDNQLRELISSNTSTGWEDGTLNQFNATPPMAASQVGLHACPDPVGIRLWYSSNATTFQQLIWSNGVWSHQAPLFGVDGYTSPSCYSPIGQSTAYVTFVDAFDNVDFFWQDEQQPDVQSRDIQPESNWSNSSNTIPNVTSWTSIDSAAGMVFAQLESDLKIHGYNVSFDAQNTAVASDSALTVDGDVPLHGSKFRTWEAQGSLLVFYQTLGNDIAQYSMNEESGEWLKTEISIPTS